MASGRGWFCAVLATAGTIDVPAGSRVLEVSAVAGGVAGSVQVVRRYSGSALSLPAVPLDAGESFYTYPSGLDGPCSVIFLGIVKGFVAWEGA
jgi:hypothetical protein